MIETALRSAIVAEAQSWLGTPYHHRARVKGAGVDCAMILIEVYATVGLVDTFDPGEYPPDWMMHREEERYLGLVEKFGEQVETPKPGDIAVWKFGRTFSHGAIVIDWPQIIHAHRKTGGVVLADGTQADLAGREHRFYSILEGK